MNELTVRRRRRLLLTAAAVVTLVLLGTFALDAGGKVAVHLSCGQVVTSSVTLDANLNCTGDGLVVGAHNITIELHGFTIDGDDGAGDYGIDNTAGFDGVTVRNGTLTDFGFGARLSGADGNVISRVEVRSSSGIGIFMESGDHNRVVESAAISSGDRGFVVGAGADLNTIEASFAVDNENPGINVFGGDGNRIVRNDVTVNDGHGISIESGATHTTVDSNRVSRSLDTGIFVAFADTNVITHNQSIANGEAGIGLVSSDSVVIAANTVSGNALPGIEIDVDSDAAQIRWNTALGNGTHGISVNPGSGLALLEGNFAAGNAVDGIESDDSTSRFRSNTTNANGGRGIDAEPGSVDLGGNRARANVIVPQCLVISCS